jgi:hypothetical protein
MFIRSLPSDTVPVTIVLAPASQLLPAVVTHDSVGGSGNTPALRAFDERRRLGIGHFITEDEMRKSDGRPLRDLLRSHIPGVSIAQMRSVGGRSSVAYLTSPRGGTIRGGSVCYPDILVDGTPAIKTGQAPDLNDFTVSQFAAVEFYNVASVPAQFNATGNACGVLLLWSRIR